MTVFLETFEEYGWLGIVGLIVCMIVFLLLQRFGNKITGNVKDGLSEVGKELAGQMKVQNEELVHTIMNQQQMLIEHIVNKDRQAEENHNIMINERMINAEDINMKLKDIMNIHHSQRAFILEFHNSYQNLSGVPFAKYSCNYEWFDKGLSPLANKCMGLPFSSIAKIVQDVLLSTNQQMVYTDMEKLEEENPSITAMFSDNRVHGVIYTGLYDNRNSLIGLLVLEYHDKIDTDLINLHQLNIQAAELTSILNIRYKYTK